MIAKARKVWGKKYISNLIEKLRLSAMPSHNIWESGDFEKSACVFLGIQKEDLRIGNGKLNFHYNHSFWPTIGLWANKDLSMGILWYASREIKKEYKICRKRYYKNIRNQEQKITQGNFTWVTQYESLTAGGKSYNDTRWQSHYIVTNGKVTQVYGFSHEAGYEDILPGVRSNYDEKTPAEGKYIHDPDFIMGYTNISGGCGNGTGRVYGNGKKFAGLIQKLYPEITIP